MGYIFPLMIAGIFNLSDPVLRRYGTHTSPPPPTEFRDLIIFFHCRGNTENPTNVQVIRVGSQRPLTKQWLIWVYTLTDYLGTLFRRDL